MNEPVSVLAFFGEVSWGHWWIGDKGDSALLWLVRGFGRLFKRAVGNTESLSREAARRRQRYLHAPGSGMLSAG